MKPCAGMKTEIRRLGGGSPLYVKKKSQAAQRKLRVSYNLLRSMMQKITLSNLVSHYW